MQDFEVLWIHIHRTRKILRWSRDPALAVRRRTTVTLGDRRMTNCYWTVADRPPRPSRNAAIAIAAGGLQQQQHRRPSSERVNASDEMLAEIRQGSGLL